VVDKLLDNRLSHDTAIVKVVAAMQTVVCVCKNLAVGISLSSEDFKCEDAIVLCKVKGWIQDTFGNVVFMH
jgi:hypothetical protein